MRPLYAQNNAVPFVDLSIRPVSAAPGSAGFTLTVNGSGFATDAVVNWNGSPRTTTFISGSKLEATINAADVAHVGTRLVTVVNPAPGGGKSNVVYFPVRAEAAAVAFAPAPTVSAPEGFSAAGDFDGDGILDLAVGTSNTDGTGSIYLYRGLGNGTFAAPVVTSLIYPIQGSLMTGDFNHDGKLDLVATVEVDYEIDAVVLLGNGAGHFTMKTPFSVGDDGWVVGVADVNRDGILDVLCNAEANGKLFDI